MAKTRIVHHCSSCGAAHARWAGRCGTCGEWNTIAEEGEAVPPAAVTAELAVLSALAAPSRMTDVGADASTRLPTGIGELDRVLSGGLVPGSVTLLGGEPGIGKSTLVLQALASVVAAGSTALLVSAEESAEQVRLRAARLDAVLPELWILPETSLAGVASAVDGLRPDVVVVDSIQTISDPTASGPPGSVSQVTACAQRLAVVARERGIATVLVGHVTKEGALAGPRALEHLVDTVLAFEGDRDRTLRMLRALKHRHGPTGELGLFEMTAQGLTGVLDAGHLFLGDRREGVAGSAVVATLEGRRPLLVELQSLVNPADMKFPRRSAQGLDAGRLGLLLAVLHRYAGLDLTSFDVWASAAGGARVVEPAGDLALALAVVSAAGGSVIPSDLVACGEIGLGGEVRQVDRLNHRLAEAARLGFRRALVPADAATSRATAPLETLPVGTVAEALALLELQVPKAPPKGTPTTI